MYDLIVVGGGLAGLANAILLAKAGVRVALFEKNEYPFHRVCGEYISNETLPFLQQLGINPFEYGAADINTFALTAPKGKKVKLHLDSGGFGISRFCLDNLLFQRALAAGVLVFQKTQITTIDKENLHWKVNTQKGEHFEAKIIVSAHGKLSTLDSFWKRAFFVQKSPYVGVKYHIRYAHQADNEIALHNFLNGYCGISRVENGASCLCYLTSRQQLKEQQSIENLEKNILQKNPHLRHIFENAEFLFEKPKVINEISFAPKTLSENGVLMCGDSAGMIAPLAGNGMAMALQSAGILSALLLDYFNNQITENQLLSNYQQQWKQQFATRLYVGRTLQKFFGNATLSELLIATATAFPTIAKKLIKMTHQ